MSDHALPPPAAIRPEEFVTPPVADVVRKRSLVIGVVAALLSVVALFVGRDHFFRAYLVAYMLWLGVTLGCLALLMLQYLSGGTWGLIIRRQLQAASKQIPLMGLFFVPLIFGMRMYPWADKARVAGDEILRHRESVMDPKWWIVRAVIYFVAWGLLGWNLTRLSEIRDHNPGNDYAWRRRFQKFAAPGLVIYGLTITFASVDWVMSLDAHWSSTMYGVLFIGGQALSALSFATAMTILLGRYEPMKRILRPDYLVDLGKLMLAFVMLWAYFAFSQFLIIWSGNLTEEIPWYLDRSHGGWQYIAGAVILGHFVLPFVLLLSRTLKKKGRALAAVAGFIIVMRALDLFWMIEPNFKPAGGPAIPWAQLWMYLVLPVAMGGLWMAAFLTSLRSRPLLPLADPLLKDVLSEGGHRHGA